MAITTGTTTTQRPTQRPVNNSGMGGLLGGIFGGMGSQGMGPSAGMGPGGGGMPSMGPPQGAGGLLGDVSPQEVSEALGELQQELAASQGAPSGLRGILGPEGQPRMQPANFGTAYQNAQMVRDAYPGLAGRTSQPQMANALNTFSRAMPGEAGTPVFGHDALNDVGRVGINQMVGGFSPEKMLRGMDTTGMRPATRGFENPGPHSMGMVAQGSPEQTLALGGMREALMGQGVSPQAMNASNFVAAGTPMVRGVNPVGTPVNGTQFGADPTWGNRIAMANAQALPNMASPQIGMPPQGALASVQMPQQQSMQQASMADTLAPSFWEKAKNFGATASAMTGDALEQVKKANSQVQNLPGGWQTAAKLAKFGNTMNNLFSGALGPSMQVAEAGRAGNPNENHQDYRPGAPKPEKPKPNKPNKPNKKPFKYDPYSIAWQFPQYTQTWAFTPPRVPGYMG